ncbi:MAG: TolC family protein [Candidatus Omnitrophota bacterium]
MRKVILYIYFMFLFFSVSRLYAEGQKEITLGLEDTLRLAMENNFDIKIFKIEKSISEKDLLAAGAVYDTMISADYSYNKNKLKKSSTFLGSEQTTVLQNISFHKKLPSGTLMSLGLEHKKDTSDSLFAALNPYHENIFSLSLEQPVGKNILGLADRNTVKIARLAVDNSGYTSLNKIERELAAVKKSYWCMVYALESLTAQKEIVLIAEELFKQFRKNFEMGTVEESELFAVEADMEELKRNVLFSQQALSSAMNELRFRLDLGKNITIIPEDKFDFKNENFDFNQWIITALNNRRDYLQAKNNLQSGNLNLEMKKNARWPEIDLFATLNRNGLAADFKDSFAELSSEDYTNYLIGVSVSFSLENNQAKSEYLKEQLKKLKSLIELKKTESKIMIEVNDAVNAINLAIQAVEMSQKIWQLQNKKYEKEWERFKSGRSDTDKLVRFRQDTLRAQLGYISALYDYQTALIDLELVTNTLLDTT